MTSMEHFINGNHFFTLLALVLAIVALVLATTHDKDDHNKPMFSKTITLALDSTTDTGVYMPVNFIATGFSLKTIVATNAGTAVMGNIGTTRTATALANQSLIPFDLTTTTTTRTFWLARPYHSVGRIAAENILFQHTDLTGQTPATVEFELYGSTME